MSDLAIEWIHEYLERVTSQLEVEIQTRQSQTLLRCDGVDLLDYIEVLQRYRQAVAMQRDIIRILQISRQS